MKLTYKIFLMGFLLLIPLLTVRAHKYYEPRTNDYVDTLTGVKIIWQEIQFPTKWLYGPISATYSFIEEREKNRFVPIILKAMRKYPAAVLKKNLKRIYLVGYLSFYGVKFGGTNSNDCLYLCNEGSHRGYTDFYLEQIFHHEFSSILLRNYPQYFQKEEWIKYTKHEFQEGATGVDAIKNGTNKTEFDEELCHKGILYQYALSTLENDFNSYAENIFCPTKEFWKVVEQYPNVRQKLYLIIDFYHEINKEFDMNYFLRFKHGYFD